MISDKVVDIIKFYALEINRNLWEALYDQLYHTQDLDFSYIGEFTECMLQANIQPLDYLNSIPEAFLCQTGVSTFTIPDHIKSVKSWAFSNCKKLQYIFIPDHVEFLDENSFAYCEHVSHLILMNPDIDIDPFAFYDTEIDTITYNGSKQEWENKDFRLVCSKVICTDGVY